MASACFDKEVQIAGLLVTGGEGVFALDDDHQGLMGRSICPLDT